MRNLPLEIDFSGEAAYSHNNPNSIGVALIDSMEGAKESTTVPTLKYNWRPSSLPYIVEDPPVPEGNIYSVTPTIENRATFKVVLKDKKRIGSRRKLYAESRRTRIYDSTALTFY